MKGEYESRNRIYIHNNMREEHKYILRAIERLFGLNTKNENIQELQRYDWDIILYQATLHKVIPVIYYDLIANNLASGINNQVFKLMKNITTFSKHCNDVYKKVAYEISKKASQEEIDLVVLKGPILESFLYSNPGMRMYNDLDVLIDKKDLSRTKKLLRGMGFVQGNYDKNTGIVIPATRREILEKELYSHETIEFHKIEKDSIVNDFVVDINHAITWKNGDIDDHIEVGKFLSSPNEYDLEGINIIGPNPEILFIHTCMHLYSEAVLFCWQYSWYKNYGDSELRKYIDVGLFFNKTIDWKKVKELIVELELEACMIYVLTQFYQLFPTIHMPEELQEYISDENYTGYYYLCNGKKNNWSLSIIDRVFEQETRKEDVMKNIKEGEIKIKKA